MTSQDIRSRFLTFFKKRGHTILPSASLVPENDPTVLFNTAGMQPLVPYLLGAKHPQGTRLADVQKCVRTGDIEDIGDTTHATFFEMLGNWSLGDYFKKEAIEWSYELLTSKTEGFGLDPKRLYVTVFAGDANSPRDTEALEFWKKAGVPEHRIYFLGADANWWPAVKGKDTWTGPTGPCSEMFYDVTKNGLGDLNLEQFKKADDAKQVVEIWNDVFMEFVKKDGKITGKLEKHNVDTGAGLERISAVLQKVESIFDTDLFTPIMQKMDEFTSEKELVISGVQRAEITRAKRIIADHIRAAVFIISDGITPSNTDQGYVLRRLLRRAVRYADVLKMKHGSLFWIAKTVIDEYSESYPELAKNSEQITKAIDAEEQKFRKTLAAGLKEFEKIATAVGADKKISGTDAFQLFSTYGFPIDVTLELAHERHMTVDREAYEAEFKKHQDLSRTGAEKKFKGGLGDTSEISLRYHTATHLLHQALRDVLGNTVSQKGSNITPERLRFDFAFDRKMTDDEKKRVEQIVNEKIAAALPMNRVELPKAEAEKTGALHLFGDKYGDTVSVYYIGDSLETAYSKEFCGGPHVTNTKELGHFAIQKEEAVSAGVRRIKAVLS